VKGDYGKLIGVALAAAVAVALLVLIVAARHSGPSPEAALQIALDMVSRSRGWSFREKIVAWLHGEASEVRAEGVVDAERGALRSTIVVSRGGGAPRLYIYYRNRSVALIIYEGGVVNATQSKWRIEDTVLYQAISAALEEPEKEIHRRDDGLVVVSTGRPTRSAEALYERLFAMAYPEEEPPRPDTASILVTLSPSGEPRGLLMVYYLNGDKVLEAVYVVEDFNSPPEVEPPVRGETG